MERAANPLRGEVSMTLGGRAFTLRPSFAAIVTVEERLGSVISLALKASKGELGLREATALLWETLDQRTAMSEEELGGLILQEGVAAVAPAVSALLAAILRGSRHAET
jgi:hypothetical protein